MSTGSTDRTEQAGATLARTGAVLGLRGVAILGAGVAATATLLPLRRAAAAWLGGAALALLAAGLLPVRTDGLRPRASPAGDPDEARRRFAEELDRLGDEQAPDGLHARGASRLWHHGERTACAVVVLHGLSNSPHATVALGDLLHARGHSVVAPRLPQHGHADLATDALKRLRAGQLRRLADAAVDVAAGLGERVVVVGTSAGGAVAAWTGQHREEVDRVVLVSPFFGLAGLGHLANRWLLRLLLLLPSTSLWKDPRLKARYPGLGHNYKRQHSRAVGEVQRLGLAVLREATRRAPAATEAAFLTNAADRAVDNGATARLARRWRPSIDVAELELPAALGLGHELLDPADPGGDVEAVYPLLVRLVEGELPAPVPAATRATAPATTRPVAGPAARRPAGRRARARSRGWPGA